MASPAKPAKKCIFCGGGRLSKEHIWPEWANPLIVKHPAKQRVEHRYTIDPDKTPKNFVLATQPGDVTTKKLRVVCITCNNTWMSAIEEAAKPHLVPLINGNTALLRANQQHKIATWVALKCMIMEETEPNAKISTAECLHHFRLQRSPPDGMHIWAGDCGEAHWVSAFFRTAATVTESLSDIPPIKPDGSRAKNAHYISFGIGRAFFFVFYTTRLAIDPNFRFNPVFLRRLWPFAHDMRWTPLSRLTSIQCNSIRDAYSGIDDNPPGVFIVDV